MNNPNSRPAWRDLAETGGRIPSFTSFTHRKTGAEVSVALSFSRAVTGDKPKDEMAEFSMSPSGVECLVSRGFNDILMARLEDTFSFLIPFLERDDLDGAFAISLGDEGVQRTLSFSACWPDFLVPDPDFLRTQGYEADRRVFEASPPWEDRADRLYWRGTDTGVFRYRRIEDAPRVAVCRIGRENPHLINAAITAIQHADAAKRVYYLRNGYLGPRAPQHDILKYRYQIDIDGNASAWSSLFLKLLSGSTVLKVDSELNWRQWYYADLVPWTHYVPVLPDLSDLLEKLNVLRDNPLLAKRIGEAGRAFALERTMHSELRNAEQTLERLVILNRRVSFASF